MRSSIICSAGMLLAVALVQPVGAAVPDSRIEVLSNRADLISGGDALVQLDLPTGVRASAVKVDLDGTDISSSFALRTNGKVQGLVTGLVDGDNRLTSTLPDGSGARLTITNHPIGGPVIAGAQIQPWTCQSGAIDAQCNQPAVYHYEYFSWRTRAFADYDPANPPRDVARTRTDQGNIVPYIVRVESGYIDRGSYRIAVLFNPSQDWKPWAPQRGWNGKLVVPGGFSCGVQHGEGDPANVLVDDPLSRGFAVIATSLTDNDQNCNMVVQAEALMMLKEHFIESYGPVRYTIGTGCSGGSIYQQQNANGYPGLLDGIIPQCSFPDTFTTAREVEDCALLLNYWNSPDQWGSGVSWSTAQETAVTGHPALTTCQSWVASGFNDLLNPRLIADSLSQNCAIDAGVAWTPENPGGVRCTLADYMVSIGGTRPQDGYANNPTNNIGVQYGLGALMSGAISPAQFVDLNAKIGSHDINYDFQSSRRDADTVVLAPSYRGGLINEATQLASVPIIDLRGHDRIDIHLDYHSFELRARLDRANGNHGNQIIWMSPLPLVGAKSWPKDSLTVMDEWLSAIEADMRALPLATKVAEDKPADATDRCYNAAGKVLGDLSACRRGIQQYSQNPRMVAGEALTNDDYRCQLKPLNPYDYAPIGFTAEQWTQLQQTFPDGVCDYSKPGVGQQATVPWQTYANGPGGQPLGDAPVSDVFSGS